MTPQSYIDIKKFIKQNLLNKNGNPNTNRTRNSNWFIKNNYTEQLDFILKSTNFLDCSDTITKRIQCILQDITKKLLCKNCKTVSPTWIDGKYLTYCSAKCASNDKDIIKKRIESYDYEKANTKRANTNFKKYNCKCPLQNKEVKEKSKKTMMERYGVEHFSSSELFIEKSKKTMMERYGEINTFLVNEFKEKSKKTMMERYGVDNYSKTSMFKNSMKYNKSDDLHIFLKEHKKLSYILFKTIYENSGTKVLSKVINLSESATLKWLVKLDIDKIKSHSRSEKNILEYLKNEFDEDVIENDRSILQGKELDIYIPSANLAIEYNGLYWHSDKFKESNYHLNKTIECEKKGIQLLHVFEGENEDLWKSVIKSKLGLNKRIYARKCILKTISNKESKEFLNDNHLQGNCGSSVKLGLYFEDELVSIMTFGKPRFNKNYDWELIRFCSKRDITVVGGASKLLTNFRRQYKGSIISYANRRWSDGGLYKTLGFDTLNISKPNYFYFKKDVLESRNKYQKHKLKKMFPDSLGTEFEIMLENGFKKIYDSGNIAFEFPSLCDTI